MIQESGRKTLAFEESLFVTESAPLCNESDRLG